MKKSIIAIILICSMTFVLVISSVSVSGNNLTMYDYSSMNENQIYDLLLTLSKEELISEARVAFQLSADAGRPNGSNLIPFASALAFRINEYSEEFLFDIILSLDENEYFADTVLSAYDFMYEKRTEISNERIKSIINDEKYPVLLRHEAVLSADFDPDNKEDIGFLTDIVFSGSGIVSSQALETLSWIDLDYAEVLADNIINEYTTFDRDRLNVAIQVKSTAIADKGIFDRSYEKFVSVCNAIVESDDFDEVLKDRAVFGLADLKDRDVVLSILENDRIDDVMKAYTVKNNYEILVDLIENDTEKIDLICDSVSLYPMEDFKEPLKKVLKNKNGTNIKKIKDTIKVIDAESELEKIQGLSILGDGTVSQAASTITDYSGYSLYSASVSSGIEWHAALIVNRDYTCVTFVVHHIGADSNKVTYGRWPDIRPANYVGTYKPKGLNGGMLTTKQVLNIVTTAKALVAKNTIAYTLLAQIAYSNEAITKVEPNHITKIRCDGVVEYCYEYNNIRIFGDLSNWDISKPSKDNLSAHSGVNVTPKKQATENMILITSEKPKAS